MTTSTKHTESRPGRLLFSAPDHVDPLTGEILFPRQSPFGLSPADARMQKFLAYAGAGVLEYLDQLAESHAAQVEGFVRIEAPGGGWRAFWQGAGAQAAARYLEQKAKTHTGQFEPSGFTCDKAGLKTGSEWALLTECSGERHPVAKALVCGREWCRRCGSNASPESEGSIAHRRRIARWLPKALQMREIGYFTATVPLSLRPKLRDKRELSALGIAFKRLMERSGFSRGLRRWHWFGEPENGVNGTPIYSPHLNVLVDGGWLSPAILNRVKAGWKNILERRYRVRLPVVDVHYTYAVTPGQKYHRVRYVTRATFLSEAWDQQMSVELAGFRSASTWGKWDGESVWTPPQNESPPSVAEQAAVQGLCPRCETSVTWDGAEIVPAYRLEALDLEAIGSGFFVGLVGLAQRQSAFTRRSGVSPGGVT